MKSTIRIAATETASLNSTAWFPPPPRLMTEREVCAWLNTSKRNLFCWRKAGLIPYLKIGRAVRFRRDDVEQALSESIRPGSRPWWSIGREHGALPT